MDTQNKFYIVQSKDNKLIKKSSSGGVFAELARYTLAQNGVVFGCAMERVEEGFDVRHIYIEEEKDLYKLQGSKYVQSRLGDSIKQAKDFLDSGRFVLFSGTPCQIAGLKSYLKQDYDNLLTVDLSCEGTPPLKIFNDYIEYLEKNVIKSKILDFKFRSKKHFGWSTSGFVAIYEKNGKLKEKILPQNLSSYFTYFLKGDILQERCFSCKFTGTKRIGDITIADAWGIEQEYPELLKSRFNKNKGISLVLINSLNGAKFFNNLEKDLITQDIDVNRLRKYNHPLRHPSIKSPTREQVLEIYNKSGYYALEQYFQKNLKNKYYYILKNHTPTSIKSIIKLFLHKQERIDCLLMTAYHWENYGSLLAAYSLYKTIRQLGYTAQLIHYCNYRGFGKIFVDKYLPLTKRYLRTLDFIELNKYANTFILGSDNLINFATNSLRFVSQNLFNFTDDYKKRIMISGSIGAWDGLTKNQTEHDYVKFLLDRFDYISTREEHGKQVFENIFNQKVDWINDPVFYLDKQNYIDLTKDIKEDYSNKIMQYILYPTENTKKIVEYYKQKKGLKVVQFEGNENVKFFLNYKDKTVEHWLSAIFHSKLVITDSFHCTAFCLIFNKPFVCIKNTHSTVRFTSLFKKLGINLPLIETINDLKEYDMSYDIDKVNKQLGEIKDFALIKIKKALSEPKKEYINNEIMEKYNKDFLKNNIVWYKKNKLFYYCIIEPFVIPIIRILKDIKND